MDDETKTEISKMKLATKDWIMKELTEFERRFEKYVILPKDCVELRR